MTATDFLPLPFVAIMARLMTALSSARAFVVGMLTTPREPTEPDPTLLMLAAFTFIVLGVLVFALIAVSAPQLRHFAHSGF